MNQIAFDKICELYTSAHVPFTVLEHRPCGPSEEAATVRREIGISDAMGAKALLLKLYLKDKSEIFATVVLPADHKLTQSSLKQIPDYKLNRFATPQEMLDVAGVSPGCMPPFGPQVFPGVHRLYICERLLQYPKIAFNAAYFEKSLYMPLESYVSVIQPDLVFTLSEPK